MDRGLAKGLGLPTCPLAHSNRGLPPPRNHFAQFNHKDGESVTGRDPSKGKEMANVIHLIVEQDGEFYLNNFS